MTFSGIRTPFASVLRPVKIVSLLLVALWLPATLHCRLEALGFAGLFNCPEESSSMAHETSDGCHRDSCHDVESGQFTLAKGRVAPASLPLLAGDFALCFLCIAPSLLEPEFSSVPPTEPLPLQSNWQFVRRAALPARAPDFLNT